MTAVDDFSRLVSGIYDGVMTPERWDGSMADIASAFGAFTAALVVSDHNSRTLRHAQMPAAAAEGYAAHYERLDHVLSAVETGPLGAVRTGAELMWPYQNCEFQADWARPNGLEDGLFVRLTPGSPVTSLAIATVKRSDRFDSADRIALINRLVPHLQQALRLRGRLEELDHHSGDLAAAGEAVGHGIVIVAAGRRSVYINSAADSILRSNDGLRIHRGCIEADASRADAQLQLSVARALNPDSRDIWGGSFLCPRPSGRRPFVVHVAPIDPTTLGPNGATPQDGRAIIVIIDPEGQPEPPATLLRRLYGLTRSEADVALLVMRGEGLKPIADELSVSVTTVRTHLQHVFDKTGTSRQAELVRLLIPLYPLRR